MELEIDPAEHERVWPELRLDAWQPTFDSLHLWTQMAGKIRLGLAPPQNHFWHVPLYVTARGLTTSPIPYGTGTFEIQFDLLDHTLLMDSSSGRVGSIRLQPKTVAEFHRELLALLEDFGVEVHLNTMPQEVADPIPFEQDTVHREYDPDAASRYFRVLLQADRVLKRFMGGFQGKQSPTHLFWGGFDLAQTRFSNRRGPPRPADSAMTRECYSHEEMTFGFWPGVPGTIDAAFYAYIWPEPDGFRDVELPIDGARYLPQLANFVLPYARVRALAHPREAILRFYDSAYLVGATLGGWDRADLDRVPVAIQPGLSSKQPPEQPHAP